MSLVTQEYPFNKKVSLKTYTHTHHSVTKLTFPTNVEEPCSNCFK